MPSLPLLTRARLPLAGGFVHLAAAADLDDAGAEEVRVRLTEAEQRRFDGLAPAQRRRFATGRALLLGLRPGEDVRATCPRCGGAHGAPRVGEALASVSHAAGRTVVALGGPGAVVGVDIEPFDQGARAASALAALTAGPSAEPTWALRRWTAIEAVLKADGRGLEANPGLVAVEGDTARVGDRPFRYRLAHPAFLDAMTTTVAVRID